MSSLLELKGLTKDYLNDEVVTNVLKGLNLNVDRGEFIALMGPSGSGKSTLMHIMSFLDRPTSGSYLFDEQRVNDLTDDELAKVRRDKVGFVFQAFNLLPKMTSLENVMLPLVYAEVSLADRRSRGREALVDVGLGDRADYLPSQLSGGQRQRVAIARALIANPSVIFADEPTGNLDSVSSTQVLELLQGLHKQGRTIVMVTHESDAAAYASRIVRLRDGQIQL